MVEKAKNVAYKAEMHKSSEEYGFLFRKELISNLVHTLIEDIGIVKVDDKHRTETGTLNEYELGFTTLKSFSKQLKDKTFASINRTNAVQLYEKQGERVIKGIFDALTDEKFNKRNLLLPVEYRGMKDEIHKRGIADFISGMMDSYAINYFKQLYGEGEVEKMYDPSFFRNYKQN